jgi:hypothetical protein
MPRGQYERRNRDIDDGKREEIVTGVPATENVPVGSTQFDAFKEHAKEVRDNVDNPLGQTYEPIEAKGVGEDIGFPLHRIEEMADESARSYAHDVRNVHAKAQDKTLTVTITTIHGTSAASADVDKWTEANVKKALSEIEKKISGEDSGADAPKDRLAEAVRDIASGKE